MYTGVCWGKHKGRNHSKDLSLDGMVILKLNLIKWDGVMDWTDLAQDRDRCRALVNAVINLRVL